jgi:hypothetical protein
MSNGGSSDYYKIPHGATELADLIEYREMNFNVGNIFKASYRLGSKPGVDSLYDLNKIIWFATREIARIEKQAKHDKTRHVKDSPCCGENR